MGTKHSLIFGAIVSITATFFFNSPAFGQSDQKNSSSLKIKFDAALKLISDSHRESKGALDSQYINGLKRLEKKLQSEGKLDELVEVKNEWTLFEKSGTSGTGELAEIKYFRKKLDEARKPIDKKKSDETTKLANAYIRLLEPLQVSLTKSGDITGALSAKKEITRAKGFLSEEKPGIESIITKTANASSFEKIPSFNHPVANSKIFEQENWPTKATIPQGNYRIRGKVAIKHTEIGEILISKGTIIRGAEKTASWTVGASIIVAKETTFNGFNLYGDLKARFFFTDCNFIDMNIGKGGAWGGGGPMTRWQFRNCKIKGSFIGIWNSKKIGIQMRNCQIERVEFPSIEYEKDFGASEILSGEWAVIQDCYFRKCAIPMSVLSLMDNCSFDDCRFIDDPASTPFNRTVSRVIFVKDCKWLIKNLPSNLTIDRKPLK